MSKKQKVRVLVRNPNAEASKKLLDDGADIATGNLDDEESIYAALEDIDGAFLVTTPFSGIQTEINQGKTFVKAAKRRNLKHLVFSSIDGAERKSKVPHFESKFEIEKAIIEAEIPHTILRTTAFCANFPKRSSIISFLAFGLFDSALNGKKLQFISVDDIGHVSADVLVKPSDHLGKIIQLAGDELTINDVQEAYGRVQGYKPWKVWLPSLTLRLLPNDFRLMFEWFYHSGFEVDINKLKSEFTYVKSFEEWLKDN